MKKPGIVWYVLSAIAVLGLFSYSHADQVIRLPEHDRMQEGTIKGPFVHRNLQLFLIHGKPQLEQRRYLTLGEAMEMNIVVVAETGSVQQLTIENKSKDKTVFIHAGDVVKGGRQDRTIRHDLILPPLSGPVAVGSMCVESGRWGMRGREDAARFSTSKNMLTSRALRRSSRESGDQRAVWDEIERQQTMLGENVSELRGYDVEVRDARSRTSLELTLGSQDLQKVIAEYEAELKPLLDDKTNVLGFVFAINGEINTAEVYNNESLFRALWPRLLRAAAVEAVSEYRKGKEFEPVCASDLPDFFKKALSGTVAVEHPHETTVLRTYTTATTILFETLDAEADSTWIHKTFINKGDVVVPLTPEPLLRR